MSAKKFACLNRLCFANGNQANKIFFPKHFIHHSSNTMNIFIPNLHKD